LKIDQSTGSGIPLRLPAKSRPATARPAPDAKVLPGDRSGNVVPFPEQGEGSFDAAKVAAIKDAIRAGRYKIDPERIADGMLATLRELAARKPDQ
jgi:negative regulator of flagellin synthesis FlgM